MKDGVGRKNQCYPARIRRFFRWKNARAVCVSIYTVCTSKMEINVLFDMKMPNGNSFSFGIFFSYFVSVVQTKRNDTERNERKQLKDAFNRNRKQIEYTRPLHVHVIVYYA